MTESEAIAMEKTNDEKRLACLNEIHRIILGGQGQAMAGANIVVSVEEFTIQFLSCGQHIWEICTTDTYSDWSLAYRLLGLEARDAVAALSATINELSTRDYAAYMKSEAGRLNGVVAGNLRAIAERDDRINVLSSRLQAERARAANLVEVAMQWEFFEEHAKHFIVEGNGLTEYLRHAMDYDNWCQALKALEEWKGGAGE